ncbi:hypothetical protein HDU67_004825 [Dinochytrium kinnereticum]|nr:hypothetical protein HDU67_004825 [Dinochytrium kinnereticum]
MWNGNNVPHLFSMAQEYNFYVHYQAPMPDGTMDWATNWLSPCGWLNVIRDPTNPFIVGNFVVQPVNTWIHLTVTNDNGNITMYLNGIPTTNIFCPLQFELAPVWTIGIRDWSTDVAKMNQLTPYYPYTGEISEFRFWRKPLTRSEILSQMHRTLRQSELQDPSLMLYFDFNNITNGHILNDLSSTKRVKGMMGGALGLDINVPELVPSTAPVINLSTNVVTVTMKESGEYPNAVQIPLYAIDDLESTSPLLTASSPVIYSITSLPDPNIIVLSRSRNRTGVLSGSGVIRLGSNSALFAIHRADMSVAAWPTQDFTVTVTFGGTTLNVLVRINIVKNAAPSVGDNGGAIVPLDQPATILYKPITIPNFSWRNASYNTPLTLEYWTVGAENDRFIDVPDISHVTRGRFNSEMNKNLVMDYGWDYDGSGRTIMPVRRKFGLWNHVAVVSTGKGGTQTMYFNGVAVAQSPGNVAMRMGELGLPPSNLTGFIESAMTGNVVMDEFRIWSIARTPEQLRSGMFERLTGREPGLHLYHNFDNYTVQRDGSYIFRDQSANGYDLICRGYISPSACPLSRSNVPIGGIVTDINFNDGSNVTYWDPLGNDVDDDTAYLRFVIDVLPADAKMFAERNQTLRSLDGDLRFGGVSNPSYVSPISVGSYFRKMQFIPSVMIVPSSNGGGNPYDSFQYHVTDGLRNSRVATIQIYRKCWPGTYLDQAQRKCLPCSPGFYSTGYSYSSVCLPCPPGTSQPLSGSASCIPCQQAIFLSIASASNSTTGTNVTAALPSTVVGIEDVASFGTFQDATGQPTCKACPSLTYALRSNALICDGQAFVPRYVSLSGSSDSYPSVSGMSIPSSNLLESLRSVLDPSNRTSEVSSALEKARIINAPRAVVATGSVIAGVTLMGLIGTFLFINDPVIKSSSPIALTITAFGIIMGSLSVITYSVEPTKASCIAEIWMMPVSFSVVIGMLISKTFRILRIFNNPRAHKIRMTNFDLFVYMLVAASGNVIILIIWSIYDPPQPVVVSRGSSDGLNFIYCRSKSAAVQAGFSAILYLYNAAILAILASLAFMTRSVNALFSESKFIGYFVAATVFSVSLFIPILYFLTNDISGIYVIKSVTILVITATASITLIGIKFLSIFRNRQKQASGVPIQNSKSAMLSPMGGMHADKNGKAPINSLHLQLLKNFQSTMVANCVYPSKKLGVVFWNAKVAVLQPELKILFVFSPDAPPPAKGAPPMPENITFPLTKFTVASQESPGGASTASIAASVSHGSKSSLPDNISATSSPSSPILIITNTESGHSVTLQFETSAIKKDWQNMLNQISEGTFSRFQNAASRSGNMIAASKIDLQHHGA